MSFRLENKIEPTMTRRLSAGMQISKLTSIDETRIPKGKGDDEGIRKEPRETERQSSRTDEVTVRSFE